MNCTWGFWKWFSSETKDLGNKLAQVIGIMQMRYERKLSCQIIIFKRVAINYLLLIEYSAKLTNRKENFISLCVGSRWR